MFGPFQPRTLGEGQTSFDWDVEGHKSYAREEQLPRVEEQLPACESAAAFLVEAGDFPQEHPESASQTMHFLLQEHNQLRWLRLLSPSLGMPRVPGRKPATWIPLGPCPLLHKK